MKNKLWIAALLTLPWVGMAEEDTYPLETCVVSDEGLYTMDGPVIYKYENREVRFCCKDCIKDFLKEPAKYLKKIDDAAAAKNKEETPAANEEPTPAEEHDHEGSHDHHHE